MARFFTALILTFGLFTGTIWWWVAEYPMKLFDPEYAMWLAKRTMLDNCIIGKLTVIGDSKAFASLIPGAIDPGVFNLAIGGVSFITLEDVARRIVACPQPPQAILMSFHFKWFYTDDNFWDREIKFGLFNIDPEDVRSRSRAAGDLSIYDAPSPLDADARLKNFLFTEKFPTYYFSSLIRAVIFEREPINQRYFRDVLAMRGYHSFGTNKGNTEPEVTDPWTDFHSSALLDSYFSSILNIFNQHHIPVYFISPPYKSTWMKGAGPNFGNQYRNYLSHWENLYPNFHVVGDILPTLPPGDFGDNVHIMPASAILWSKHIAHLLNDAHIEGGPFNSDE